MFLLAASQCLTKGLVGWRSLPGPRAGALCRLCEEPSTVLGAWATLLSWAGQAGAARTFPGDAAGFEGLSNRLGCAAAWCVLCFLAVSIAMTLLASCETTPDQWSRRRGAALVLCAHTSCGKGLCLGS